MAEDRVLRTICSVVGGSESETHWSMKRTGRNALHLRYSLGMYLQVIEDKQVTACISWPPAKGCGFEPRRMQRRGEKG